MEHVYQALGFTDAELSTGSHICFFYSSKEERYNIVSSYISQGLLKGERCICIGSEDFEFDLSASLVAEISATQALSRMQLIFDRGDDFRERLSEGIDEGVNYLQDLVAESQALGWPTMRITMDTAFVLTDVSDKTDWLRLEAKISYEINKMPVLLMCQYDLKSISGQFFINILRTHPFVIVDGAFFENQFLIEPLSYINMIQKEQEPIN